MPRNRKERFGFNPWLNRERLRGTKQHKPLLAFRKPTLERIAENHDALIQETPMDIFAEQEEYVIRLSPIAYPLTQLFAEREILAEQYTNWENAHIGGVLFPGDNDTVADSEMQEIAFELMNLVKLVRMDIGGGCVLDDGTVYPTALELITVGMAHSRGLVGIDPLAPDDWIFIIVHVLPSEALSDTNYDADAAQVTDYVGRMIVSGSKVRHQAAKYDMQFQYGNTILDTVQTVQGDSAGHWTQLTVGLPMIIGSSIPPCNDCSGTTPYPPTPPTPPTPPPPITPPSLPPPTPNVPISSDTTCSRIYFDNGFTLGLRFGTLGAEFRLWGNVPIVHEVYPVNLNSAITDWLTTNVPDFDATCDRLDAIKMTLLCSYTSSDIFGLIPNPVPINNETPRILAKYGTDVEPVFFFPNDRTSVQPIEPPSIFPTFKENFCEQEHTIAIRQKDRLTGIGYETWGFEIDVADFVTEISRTPLDLQMCGIVYKKHQYLFHYAFDGTDPIKIIGGGTYIYDQYENNRIGVDTGYFETTGFEIDTDAVHGFDLQLDTICNNAVAGTMFIVYGQIKISQNHWGGSTIYIQIKDNGAPVVNSAMRSFSISDGIIDFTFECPYTYLATGHQYVPHLLSQPFPDDKFLLLNISGYIA